MNKKTPFYEILLSLVVFIPVLILMLTPLFSYFKEDKECIMTSKKQLIFSPGGIVVDRDGIIYLINDYYEGNIEVFNQEGKFLYGFDTSPEGQIAIDIDENDNIYYTYSRSTTVQIYDKKGCLIETIPNDDEYYRKKDNTFLHKDGSLYKVSNILGYISITKTINDEVIIIYKTPVLKYLLSILIPILFGYSLLNLLFKSIKRFDMKYKVQK